MTHLNGEAGIHQCFKSGENETVFVFVFDVKYVLQD